MSDWFPFWAACMLGAGYGGWMLKRRRTARHICQMAPQVLTPWLAPDLEADRPPKRYITAECSDPTCGVTVDLPVTVTIRHEQGAVHVKVIADTTDLVAHEFSHAWQA